MAQKVSFEPFTIWKDMYEQTEKTWHDIIQNTLGTESFSEGLGQIQSSYLQLHEMFSEAAETYFKQANIPTPDEIANVASLVINLEEKVDTIDDQLFQSSQANTTELSSIKNAIANLDRKFDVLVTSLEAIDKKISALSISAPAPTPVKATPKKTTTPKATVPKKTPTKTTPTAPKKDDVK
jgi:polyhydroxyalkanoic acid synthase PhaR subunit